MVLVVLVAILSELYERPELHDKLRNRCVNDLGNVDISAHLLQFDTVHGRFNQQVEWATTK